MSGFTEFREIAFRAASSRCNRRMTASQIEDELRGVAMMILHDVGGAGLLFATFPELLSMNVAVRRFNGGITSAGDILEDLAVRSLLTMMRPVWFSALVDAFDDGFVSAIEQTVGFVISAHPFARGTIDEGLARRLEGLLSNLADGHADEDQIADAMQVSENRLRLLSILNGESRIAVALGGAEQIEAHRDMAEKLNLVRGSDPDDFLKWIGEELADRRGTVAEIR